MNSVDFAYAENFDFLDKQFIKSTFKTLEMKGKNLKIPFANESAMNLNVFKAQQKNISPRILCIKQLVCSSNESESNTEI